MGEPPLVAGDEEERARIAARVVQPLPGSTAGNGTSYPDEVRSSLIESGNPKSQGPPVSKDLSAIDPSAPPAAWPAMTPEERAAFLTDHPDLLATYPELLDLHPELTQLVPPEPDVAQPGPAPEAGEAPVPEEESGVGETGAGPTYPAHEWAPGNSTEVTRQLKESAAEKSWGAPVGKDGPPTSEAEWQARRAEWEAQQQAQAASGASGNGNGGSGTTPTTPTGTTSSTSSVSAPTAADAPTGGGSGGGSGGFVATEPPETGEATFSGTTGAASGGAPKCV